MPESAEVKLTTEYLDETLENKIITRWEFLPGNFEVEDPKGYELFSENLPLMVESVKCKGKFIYFTFYNDDGYFYALHSMRLTGRWQENEDEYCRWYIETDEKDFVWFRDPRRFATIEFTNDEKVLQAALDKLGPDILTTDFKLETFKSLVEKHGKKNITAFLMNQSIMSGIGNYIKAEALYYARISPKRKTGDLNDQEIERLCEGIKLIPRIAYNKKGLSIKDYADAKGINGEFEGELKIYGKPHAKRTKTPDQRITYWDPKRQV